MRKVTFLSTVMALATMILCLPSYASFGALTLPPIVEGAEVIARGRIVTEGNKTILEVTQFLKGKHSNRINLVADPDGGKVDLVALDDAIIFMNRVGSSNSARVRYRMPGRNSDEYRIDSALAEFDITSLAAAIPKISKALGATKIDAYVAGIIELLKSKDPVLNMSALSEVAESPFSSRFSNVSGEAKKRAWWPVPAFALRHMTSANKSVKSLSLYVADRAPVSVVVPMLLNGLDDPDADLRWYFRDHADRLIRNSKGDLSRYNDISYDVLRKDFDTDEGRAETKKNFQQAWESVREAELAKDLKIINERLKSKSALEREAAKAYLEQLNASSKGE